MYGLGDDIAEYREEIAALRKIINLCYTYIEKTPNKNELEKNVMLVAIGNILEAK